MNKVKLVIWDLDNTLWNGTVFYKDKDAVTIKPGTEATLKELDKRGIKNCICSKNYYEDAEQMLKKFGIEKYFSNVQIGWGNKSDAIKKILQSFDLEPHEVIFVDDDPFQRAEVVFQISSIRAIELEDPLDILDLEGIKPEGGTEVDENRIKVLKEQRNRETAEKEFKGDFKEFLKQCDLKLVIRPLEEEDWNRVVQLINRTNELNSTGARYALENLKRDFEKGTKIFVCELKDKFGDYGLIAEVIIDVEDGKNWFIRDLAVSCRTMGRGVASALVVAILEYAKEAYIKSVKGRLINNESNWRMRPLYKKRNFKLIKSSGNTKEYKYNLDSNKDLPKYPFWMSINRVK